MHNYGEACIIAVGSVLLIEDSGFIAFKVIQILKGILLPEFLIPSCLCHGGMVLASVYSTAILKIDCIYSFDPAKT